MMLAAAALVSLQANDPVKGLYMLIVLAMETVVSDVFVVLNDRFLDFVGDVAIWPGPRTEHARHFLILYSARNCSIAALISTSYFASFLIKTLWALKILF